VKRMKAESLLQKIPTGLVNPQVAMQRSLEAEEQPGIEQIMNVPQPPPPFEVTKHQDEMKLEYAKLMLDTLNHESEWINTEIATTSKAILDIAKAEGEESGTQLAQYNAELDGLREMAKQNVINMKNAQAQNVQQAQQQKAQNEQNPDKQPAV